MMANNPDNKVRVLVTGFGPFLHHTINPSQRLVEGLAQAFNGHAAIVLEHLVLPTDFGHSYSVLQQKTGLFSPDIIISFGLRETAKAFNLESTARNRIGKVPDITGAAPPQNFIIPNGPARLRSTLPLPVLKQALGKANIPVRTSKSAGDYLCNYIFYRLAYDSDKGNINCQTGFVHIPYSTELAAYYQGNKTIAPLPEKTLLQGAGLIVEQAALSLP